MSLSRALGQYLDVREILSAAVANGGARFRLSEPRHAIRWRARAYNYRTLLREAMQREQPELPPITEFDQLKLTIAPDDPCVVRIDIEKQEGILTDLAGKKIEAPTRITSELQQVADQLARELGVKR